MSILKYIHSRASQIQSGYGGLILGFVLSRCSMCWNTFARDEEAWKGLPLRCCDHVYWYVFFPCLSFSSTVIRVRHYGLYHYVVVHARLDCSLDRQFLDQCEVEYCILSSLGSIFFNGCDMILLNLQGLEWELQLCLSRGVPWMD